MAKGMYTCRTCGRDFALIVEEHYTARDTEKKGVIPAIQGQEEAKLYDAFDCPHCGCQNIMQERKDTWFTEPLQEEEECEDMERGCVNCKYADRGEEDDPCRKCSYDYISYWARKDEEDE